MKKSKSTNKTLLSFVSGILATLLVITLINPALADTITKNIDVTVNGITVELNSKDIIVKGENYTLSNGTQTVGSISYNNTTYVPIRKVSESLGLNINYDENTQTASLTEQGNVISNPTDTSILSNPNISYDEFKNLITLRMEIGNKLTSKPETGKIYHYYITLGKVDINTFVDNWNIFYSNHGKDYLKKLYDEYSALAQYNYVIIHLEYNDSDKNKEFIIIESSGICLNDNGKITQIYKFD